MDRKQWLKLRKKGIGASDAAAIVGLNPYKTNIQLWEEKTGRREDKDISDNAFVQYGTKAEEHLRALFELDFPQYAIMYNQYRIFKNPEYSFILATLDGYLADKNSNNEGVLEIKTTEIKQGAQMQKWKDKIPDNYYIQCLHQLLSTGFDFVILKAQIKFNFDEMPRLETKHYYIDRVEVTEDLEYLKAKEIEFWNQYVEKDTRPHLLLPPI